MRSKTLCNYTLPHQELFAATGIHVALFNFARCLIVLVNCSLLQSIWFLLTVLTNFWCWFYFFRLFLCLFSRWWIARIFAFTGIFIRSRRTENCWIVWKQTFSFSAEVWLRAYRESLCCAKLNRPSLSLDDKFSHKWCGDCRQVIKWPYWKKHNIQHFPRK